MGVNDVKVLSGRKLKLKYSRSSLEASFPTAWRHFFITPAMGGGQGMWTLLFIKTFADKLRDNW